MTISWSSGTYSPSSVPTKITSSPIVFLTKPTNDSDKGWGFPLVDENGVRLPLGTLDGDKQIKSLLYERNWRRGDNPGNQVYGNIDWRGPVIDENTGERLRLTYNGPAMRYFADGVFNYDQSPVSKEIYCKGGYYAIAPKPVLGAALRSIDDVLYIFALCKDNSADVLYVRKAPESPVYGTLSLDQIIAMQGVYDHATGEGWRILTRIERQTIDHPPEQEEEALEATTPWFFNESCTQAACMRDVLVTFTDANAEEYQELGKAKYLLNIGDLITDSHVFDYLGNLSRPKFQEKYYHDIINTGPGYEPFVFCFTPCGFPNPSENDEPCYDISGLDPEDGPEPIQVIHYYVRFAWLQERIIGGEYIIACDFDGDMPVSCTINFYSFRRHQQEFNWGVDCNPNYEEPIADNTFMCGSTSVYHINECPNSCSNDGLPGCNQLPELPPYYGNGDTRPWIAGTADYYIKFTNSSGEHEIPIHSDLWASKYMKDHGVRENEFDVSFDYHGVEFRYIHYLDLRNPMLVSYTDRVVEEFVSFDSIEQRFDGGLGTVVLNEFQREGYAFGSMSDAVLLSDDTTQVTETYDRVIGYNWEGNPYTYTPDTDYGGPGWPYPQNDGLYETEFITATIEELHTVRNPNGATWVPDFYDYYEPGALTSIRTPDWIDFFNNSSGLNLVEGSWCVRDSNILISYTVPVSFYSSDLSDRIINVLANEDGDADIQSLFPSAVKLYPAGVY